MVISQEETEKGEAAVKAVTTATTGPTHGVQTRPKLPPVTNPPIKLVFSLSIIDGCQKERILFISLSQILGKISRSPSKNRKIIDPCRRVSADTPSVLTIEARSTVTSTKKVTIPKITPTVRDIFSRLLAKIMGKTGKAQGVKAVNIPAIKAIGSSKIILFQIRQKRR